MMKYPIFTLALLLISAIPARADDRPEASPDLNPVTLHRVSAHAPVMLVENGKPRASICVMINPDPMALDELVRCIKLATGVELPVVTGRIQEPALVLGDCPDAAAAGLAGSKLPVEGFAIKTAPNRVYVVGNGIGLDWGIYELLERFVGVRWYFPGDAGRCVPGRTTLSIPPAHLTDAPVFRKREIWPESSDPWNGGGTRLRELHHALRSYSTWPVQLIVHSPRWGDVEDYRKNRPEIFQLTESGTRDFEMLCYSNPRTLETYLENIEKKIKGDPDARIDIQSDTITVSPNDAEISCHCADCRRLWYTSGGAEGSASRIVASFTAKLAREVKKRWPDKKVLQLAYLNYTAAPDGIEFPDNVHVQVCGMPGMALYPQEEIYQAEEANLRKWHALTPKNKLQNWLYLCWPEDRNKAVFFYPHALQRYYRENRDITAGSFINGQTNHWPRQSLSVYCWLKLLWNPDFKVDAAIDENCRRMYGAAAATMRRLVQLQIDGWERQPWPTPRLTASNVYQHSYPPAVREQMKQLLAEARQKASADATALARVEYYAQPFADFFREADESQNTQRTPLIVPHSDQEPTLDGKLNDPCWSHAPAVNLILAYDREHKQPKYPTTLRAVWTERGITFAWQMTDPAARQVVRGRTGRDHSTLWWDDCVEMLLDVTGKNAGDYYHIIVGAGGGISDAKADNWSWNASGCRPAVALGDNAWTMEVFIPFDDFPEAIRPAPGRSITWYGNFTRHHVFADPKKSTDPSCSDEYQRLNTTYAIPSANLADFAPIQFKD